MKRELKYPNWKVLQIYRPPYLPLQSILSQLGLGFNAMVKKYEDDLADVYEIQKKLDLIQDKYERDFITLSIHTPLHTELIEYLIKEFPNYYKYEINTAVVLLLTDLLNRDLEGFLE